MSRVVLDTNVVFAAFAAHGLCESIFELCLERHQLVISPFLLGELEEKLLEKLKLSKNTVLEILALYESRSELVVPTELPMDICRDPDDVAVIGTCVSGNAEFLVTGDKDLLVLKEVQGTKILNPRGFYEFLR